MGFRCGLVGLPNVGKSTLFNALTRAGAQASNYPFCTIDPNVGVVSVPDARLDDLTRLIMPQNSVPATTQFVDIAGLVAGAAKGEGLGNQFLAHIRDVQAIAHVVRCHGDKDVTHVAGEVNPVADCETIDTELCLADLEQVEKALQKEIKQSRSGQSDASRLEALKWLEAKLADGIALRRVLTDETCRDVASSLNLLTAKPVVYVANIEEGQVPSTNAWYQALSAYCEEQSAMCLPLCASIEAELALLSEEDRALFLTDLYMDEPGLNPFIRAGYDLLQLDTFFTAGPKEVRAWTIAKGATAVEAAGVIHTDFIKGFIRAEVIKFADYMRFQGEQGAKEAGVWRLEGKQYIVEDGDVIFFRTNTA